ncbi:MAG: alpha/beta hydrolase [Alphaproteobacteria bacterium]
MLQNFDLQTFAVNGIEIRAAVAGSGPLIVLVHGWPELWYSWRHQIKPLADAGYRVVAPDMRGYGGSSKPDGVHAYDMASLIEDVVGIIDTFEAKTAILIGHDWGAPICWNTATLYPDRVSALANLSVPYHRRLDFSEIELWQRLYGDAFFYQLYFQDEGVAEAELEADVRSSIRKIYYALSGNDPVRDRWLSHTQDQRLLDPFPDPKPFPAWLGEDDIDYLVTNFEAGGFRGPLNRYRNARRDYDNLPQMNATPLRQPSCFIGGSRDALRHFVPGHDLYENVGRHCNDQRISRILEGVGHWVQQEAPEEVTAALLSFLETLD